ncbi:MAG: immunoglobulin domain-containing protein [Verrucomicrobiota bacterium]
MLIAVGMLVCLPGFSQSPFITQQPVSQTIFYGDPVSFQVAASGGVPLRYQWFRNGVAISAATNNFLTLGAVGTADHANSFSVQITNTLGAATSVVAVLTVDFGIPGAAITNRVLNYADTWRYDQSNNLDGLTWYDSAFNDSLWQSGPGLLAAENNGAITPLIGTSLVAPSAPPAGLSQGHAYYFRTTFVATNDPSVIPGPLIGTFRVDDGAMIYANGIEALRIRMPGGAITNMSFATDFPPGGGSDAVTDEFSPSKRLGCPGQT